MTKPKVIAVVGPTASGKTALAISIAQSVGGEVISADSRQVYRTLDIGTAKVTPEEMAGVPHYLLDVADPEDIYTADQFVRQASTAISDISNRQQVPIIAGGTFFYVDLLRGKMTAAPVAPDPQFRNSLEQYSNEELLELLTQQDARRASTIDGQNRRRLVRALEIIHTLGHVPEPQPVTSPYDWLILGISIDEATLKQRFTGRLDAWLAAGLLEEVAQVREQVSAARFQEFGFEYTLSAAYLDQQISLEEFHERFIQKNWQYAKRQLTWLKRDKEITWVKPEEFAVTMQQVTNFLEY